ncbi:hypothetical protein [Antarcticirhabdus aurantiaca]|uniref:hypothetical protein n=1 Tax=Antarcticirhabdus aurantiaca TaxID=2606717 RepID=UPI00131CD268|nr:hypothetical protein [Antarcticirhabdus aurantiaca]
MADPALFRSALAACGLDVDTAAEVLGVSTATVRSRLRSAGSAMTHAEADILAKVWTRINRGDVADLPEGCRDMSRALRLLRGVESIPVPGRKRKGPPPTDHERALVAAYEAIQAADARRGAMRKVNRGKTDAQ